MPKTRNEKKFIQKILQGNKKQINVFYEKYQPVIFNFVLKRVKNAQTTKDITQDTLISILNSLPNFQFKCSLKSWVYLITRHEISDHYRREKIKTILFSKLPFLEPIADQALTPENRHLRKELAEETKLVLKNISKGYSKILRLKYIEGLSMNKIAQKLKVTVKAVESRLTRARNAFKKIYKKNNKTKFSNLS